MSGTARWRSLLGGMKDSAQGVAVTARSGIVPLTPVPRVDYILSLIRGIATYGPVAAAIMANSRLTPNRVCLLDEQGSLTYREINSKANSLARGWAEQGLQAGDSIASLSRNHRGLILTMVAAGKLGAKLILMNTGFAGPQLADVMLREKAQGIAYDAEFDSLLQDLPEEVFRTVVWQQPGEVLSDNTQSTIESVSAGKSTNDLPTPRTLGGFTLLTSGTTGTPKGAPRGKVHPLSSAQLLHRIPLRSRQRFLVSAPLFHATGLSQFAIALVLRHTIITQGRFYPEQALELIEKHKPDVFVAVPTMLQRIIDLPAETLEKYSVKSVKIVFASGSALSPDLSTRIMDYFGDTLYNLYGSTEVAVATVAQPGEMRKSPGTAGRPPIGVKLALLDDKGNRITEPFKEGRIFVHSILSFKGYTDGRNKETIDGLISSGDIGHFDDAGLLYVDGRDDDMIVSGGENVFPQEVEHLLTEHPNVYEASVIGVNDEKFGKTLKAYVAKDPDSDVDEHALRSYVRAHLARYKVPREVVFVEKLPRNETGKIVRRVLLEEHERSLREAASTQAPAPTSVKKSETTP